MAKRMRRTRWQQTTSLAGILLIAQILPVVASQASAQDLELPIASQVRMIQPTDSEYRALQTLIQKYDCIGKEGKTWLSQHTLLAPYEFAVVLLTCGDRFDELMFVYPAHISEKDSLLLQRLQQAYADDVLEAFKRIRDSSIEGRARLLHPRYEEKRFCLYDRVQDICVKQLPPTEFQRLKLQRIQLPEELFTYSVKPSRSTLVPMSERGARR